MLDWNESQVTTLKRMWLDGSSASEIAARLGGGATRSTVIGKVHRLKLPGRKTNSAPKAPKPKREPALVNEDHRVRSTMIAKRANGAGQPKAAAIRHRLETGELPPASLPKPREDEVAAISLLELNEHTCKFPVGDPLVPGFGFCGQTSLEGSPYCAKHHRRCVVKI